MKACWLLVVAVCGAQAQPRLLFSEADRERINELAAREGWAGSARSAIVARADGWPAAHLARFGLSEARVPAEGGQWWHHYVCPTHGVRLTFQAPRTHRCSVDGRTFSGWPYDEVILTDRHNDLAEVARDLGLAYQLTGRAEYASRAGAILKEYAAAYPAYKIHDTKNGTARSGARMGAQTLDESIWLISIAWAYDLVRDTLDADSRRAIETDLLRASAATVARNEAGISNWQSWHNAGFAAVGFTLGDAEWIERAVNGFRFQMASSVVDEGFWYEGAWSYHFYALDALMRTAEMAARAGIDLWSDEPALGALFRVPLRLTFADGSLPTFNDSGAQNLFSQDALYEVAYARLRDPVLLGALGRRTRGRNALLWGAPEVSASPAASESAVFEKAGFAVLRAGSGDHAVAMKFGPHGGGHGHYDKLGLTSFAYGGVMAVDPGTQSYAAPTHDTWDKMTVAHNTLVVDEQRQREATGELYWWQVGDGFTAVSAGAGPAYAQASLKRTLVTTAEYTLDLSEAAASDDAEHVFDWVYHQSGFLETDLGLEAWDGFGKANGYQHLTGNRAAALPDAWRATFDGSPRGAVTYGTTWGSTADVRGRFEVSPEQAFRGRASAKASYEFNGAGYILLTSPVLSGVPVGRPAALRLQVYGDGSGHRLTLRLHDSADERFTISAGAVTWTGWREVLVRDLERWNHFSGNNDGVFDGAARNFTIQIDRNTSGPQTGAWFVDDVTLEYESESVLALDFESGYRSLRVWMLGSADTTVVTGEGLGPDLRVPVPYVLARRRGTGARFAALLEPYTSETNVVEFRELEPGVFRVVGRTFAHTVVVREGGVDLVRD